MFARFTLYKPHSIILPEPLCIHYGIDIPKASRFFNCFQCKKIISILGIIRVVMELIKIGQLANFCKAIVFHKFGGNPCVQNYTCGKQATAERKESY